MKVDKLADMVLDMMVDNKKNQHFTRLVHLLSFASLFACNLPLEGGGRY